VRICHVIDNMFLDQGGPVAVVRGLARAQAAAGEQVGVLCRAQRRSGEAACPEHALGGAVLLETGSSADAAARLRLELDRFRPDMLHLHAVWEPVQRHAARWALRHGVPWVLSSHGMLHPDPMSKGWLKKRLYLGLLGVAVRRARRVLVVNQEEADFVRRALGTPAEVMPNGVEVDAAPPSHATPPTATEGSVLFVGRLQALKGIEGLVRAYAIAARQGLSCPLALVGPDEGALDDVRKTARDAGVDDRVHLLGPIYGDAKRAALRHCRMLAHRPRYEGFGMTIVEAMAEGRPVVTTDRAGVARQCPGDILKVAPDTDEGFADAMLDLWRDPAAAQAMGDRARAWVSSQLSWPAIASRVRAAYLAP